MHYIAKTSKVQKNKLIQAKQGIHGMLCKDQMANLDYKSKLYDTKHIFPSFFLKFFIFKNKGKDNLSYNA